MNKLEQLKEDNNFLIAKLEEYKNRNHEKK